MISLIITLLAILGSMYGNRKSVEDMRDVLRGEMKAFRAEASLEIRDAVSPLKSDIAAINMTLLRLENKIDHIAEAVASHGERLNGLEGRG